MKIVVLAKTFKSSSKAIRMGIVPRRKPPKKNVMGKHRKRRPQHQEPLQQWRQRHQQQQMIVNVLWIVLNLDAIRGVFCTQWRRIIPHVQRWRNNTPCPSSCPGFRVFIRVPHVVHISYTTCDIIRLEPNLEPRFRCGCVIFIIALIRDSARNCSIVNLSIKGGERDRQTNRVMNSKFVKT